MDPELTFQNKISKHLDLQKSREESYRQHQNWTVELFRQTALHSVEATHSRDLIRELERTSQEIDVVIHEIVALMPVLVWVWDLVKNRPDLMEHLSGIEDKVRTTHRHHERHGHFFELYEKNQKGGLSMFQTAIQDIIGIFHQDNSWMQDPVAALRRIHDAQDGVVMTGVFLELIIETVKDLHILESEQEKRLQLALVHLNTLGQKLHVKEDRLSRVLKTATT